MLFNSLLFVLFFAFVFAVVCLLRRHVGARNAFLLLANFVFYGAWDWRFLVLMMGTITVDYTIARLIEATDRKRTATRKWLVAASVTFNLSVLGFFKYCNFFVDSFVALADLVGAHVSVPALQIVLPVGISFYTFQSLAYVVDVYRGHMRAERSLLNYATFISFFPQLVAGPIERASHLLPQIKAPNVITRQHLYEGFWLASVGMFKKVVLADNVAKIANVVFSAHDVTPGTFETMIGVYAFALQIYLDFSAYTDIARGTARMMGFDLMRNFDLPYFAVNPSDFWRRWHISLSTWLRDYLYIPLGGNRGSWAMVYRNLALTMLLGGLWHGATWLFVMWGAYHGLLLIVHRALKPVLDKYLTFRSRAAAGLWTAARIVVFFHITCVGWLLFRGETLANLERLLAPLRGIAPSDVALLTPQMLLSLGAIACVLFVGQLLKFISNNHDVVFRIPVPLRAIVYAGMFLGILIFGEFGGSEFIYFQF